MIKLAIAGMGYIGKVHYDASQKVEGARVVAVCTSRPDFVRQHCDSEVRLYENYHDMLLESRPDAVIVCVPTFLHEQYVIEAMAQGCHVLCEKPFALNRETAEKMVEAKGRAGVVLMVAQVLRFWPQYVEIKRMVDQGTVGSVNSVHAHRLATMPTQGDWFRDPAKSGGCLLDLQVHDVDYAYWLLGNPDEIYTMGVRSRSGCWNHVSTTLRCRSAVATIEGSFLMPDSWPFSCSVHVSGTQAAAVYDFRVSGNVSQREQAVDELVLYSAGTSASRVEVHREDMYAVQLSHFVECVKENRESSVCPLQENLEVMTIMDASLRSVETGKPITFD
jgi:predicted dehydrogenase